MAERDDAGHEDSETRYFWVNKSGNEWPENGEDLFYTAETRDDRNPRRMKRAFERARPGDKVVVYRIRPAKQVVGLGRITQGLHEEPHDDYETPVSGITVTGDRLIDGPSWEEITEDPVLENADPVKTNNTMLVGELDREEYDRILELAGETPDATTLADITDETATAYWVNQSNQAELEYEYLRAKADNIWHHDLTRLTPGDIVFHNFDGELVGLSIVSTESETYTFQGEQYRRVEVDIYWFEESLPVDDELKAQLNDPSRRIEKYYPVDKNGDLAQAYLSNLSEAAAEYLLGQVTFAEKGPTADDPDDPPQPVKPDNAEEIARQLERKKQIVFYGPPGTGKTYLAERFANWWAAQQENADPVSDRVETVTFHPSFTYEDFIEGLTVESNPDGALTYEVQDGILKRLQTAADRAYEAYDPEKDDEAPRYILIIDEINRGNLAQIFGETITLLEADKRNQTTVQLAHSDREFTLPPNLYLIGTMNTADRSIALVDAALRRRFRFIDIPPDIEVLYAEYDIPDSDAVETILAEEPTPMAVLHALSIRAWKRMNENILASPDLGKGKQIGHSYLMDLPDPIAVRDAWRYDILPLLEEYHFGQFDRIKQEIFEGASDPLIDPETERIRNFSVQALVDALSAFVGVDIETEFEDRSGQPEQAVEAEATTGDDSTYPTFPDLYETARTDILARAGDLLRAEALEDTPDTTNRALRFESGQPYIPNAVTFVFKLEPERNGQMSVHLSAEDDADRVGEVIRAHREQYESAGFDVTNASTYRIVEHAWPLENVADRDTRAIVDDVRGSEMYEEAVEAVIELIRITNEVFQDSEFAEPVSAQSED